MALLVPQFSVTLLLNGSTFHLSLLHMVHCVISKMCHKLSLCNYLFPSALVSIWWTCFIFSKWGRRVSKGGEGNLKGAKETSYGRGEGTVNDLASVKDFLRSRDQNVTQKSKSTNSWCFWCSCLCCIMWLYYSLGFVYLTSRLRTKHAIA